MPQDTNLIVDGTTYDTAYPMLFGNNHNIRLGRGITCANQADTGCTFADSEPQSG